MAKCRTPKPRPQKRGFLLPENSARRYVKFCILIASLVMSGCAGLPVCPEIKLAMCPAEAR